MSTKKKLRIILPGGGVKGVFQVGFLQQLIASEKYDIDAVYGCSIGAIIAPHTANGNVKPLTDLFLNIKSLADVVEYRKMCGITIPQWKWLLGLFAFLKLGAYTSVKIVSQVLDTLTTDEIETAQQKCHVVAYNINKNAETWFTGKNLWDGIKCSSALWLAVPPVSLNGYLYSDGGSTEVFPVDYILEHELNTTYEGDYLFLDCDARQPYTNANPTDGMTLVSDLQWGASLRLSVFELELLKEKLGDRLIIVRPTTTILTSALDINTERMKQTFDAGVKAGNAFLI